MPPPCDGGWRDWVTDGVEPDPRYTNVTPIRTAGCAPPRRSISMRLMWTSTLALAQPGCLGVSKLPSPPQGRTESRCSGWTGRARIHCCSSDCSISSSAPYRAAKRLVLILDNDTIHKIHITWRWLANNPKVTLLFPPAYHPRVNRIKRLWRVLHDTVTRNHRFETLQQLNKAVARFMAAVQPFPGNNAALASS